MLGELLSVVKVISCVCVLIGTVSRNILRSFNIKKVLKT